jgi:hypothetical protein
MLAAEGVGQIGVVARRDVGAPTVTKAHELQIRGHGGWGRRMAFVQMVPNEPAHELGEGNPLGSGLGAERFKVLELEID